MNIEKSTFLAGKLSRCRCYKSRKRVQRKTGQDMKMMNSTSDIKNVKHMVLGRRSGDSVQHTVGYVGMELRDQRQRFGDY